MRELESYEERKMRQKVRVYDPKTFGMFFLKRDKKGKWTHSY
jgi:hypothetical protein